MYLLFSKGIQEIYTGDDCISIGTNSQNVDIRNVACSQIRGISIGSLGSDKSQVAFQTSRSEGLRHQAHY
ncbi:hypothetical protein CMV_030500 [Castanea mollissima]|uniref:Polygalacturonase n=1 Tax=Castanea mollissima TaxID=60419 RepID=A0A8J4Q569_9ROSI|nr:hypothetical protein CMV_030500 [Castanea mollissima]